MERGWQSAILESASRRTSDRRMTMLSWALTFLIIALVAGVLGFGGVAGAATEIAQVLFFVFLVLLVISLVVGRSRPPV
jgi:uncharacterized membrane protein YtjA (UPF0391 family)